MGPEVQRVFQRPIRPPGMVDSYLKTIRAKEHLDTLREALNAFIESKPYAFVGEDDAEHGLYRLRITVRDTPDRISLIVGDLFYCMRASLDQLVWSLAKLNVRYPKGTQFPILKVSNPSNFVRYTCGVPAEAANIIESLQPYHAPDAGAHLLWQLNMMCNIDKHRRIPVHGNATEFRFPPATGAMLSVIRFEDDRILIPANLKSQMQIHPNVSFNVNFGDAEVGVRCDFERIEQIYNFVADNIIPRFARFFV